MIKTSERVSIVLNDLETGRKLINDHYHKGDYNMTIAYAEVLHKDLGDMIRILKKDINENTNNSK